MQPRYMAVILGLIIFFKYFVDRRNSDYKAPHKNITLLVGVAILFIVVISNSILSLKIYPVAINLTLLFIFAYSVVYPPSVIEQIAKISEPELPQSGIVYTRKVTIIWCMFFLCNGMFSLYTAIFTSIQFWTLYNGLIAYILMGTLFGSELVYRKIFLKK
ncbi:hypothetical protein [Aliikangiella sp. IMCC44359]|uniref:hypothetical protein n=1 Tax=Aliikangiella sp. IMCC44359 TaxID=3459125 RepID=UPI00403B129D